MASIYPSFPPVPDPRPRQTEGWLRRTRRSSRRDDAQQWAWPAPRPWSIRGCRLGRSSVARLHSFGDRVDLTIADLCAVGKPPRRSKAATLATLKRDMRKEKIGHLDRHKFIEYGRKRADQGAAPVTFGIDIGVVKMILAHAAAVHGPEIRVEGVDLARVALKRLGLIGKGIERDRRPTTAEPGRLSRCFDKSAHLAACQGYPGPRQGIPGTCQARQDETPHASEARDGGCRAVPVGSCVCARLAGKDGWGRHRGTAVPCDPVSGNR